MIRITIIADSVEELRAFLRQAAEEAGPRTFRNVNDLPWPAGSYKQKHAKKTGTADGRLR